jgi:dihydrofolate reductase
MHSVIAVEFVTIDGVTEDPDGTQGFTHGGWAFRYGPEAVKGDKFRLGAMLQSGALLFGRVTWQHFSKLFPPRTDPFSARMNAIRKLVASRSLDSVDAWTNSVLLRGDLVDAVRRCKRDQDVIVIGSDSIVQTLMHQDLVDEYRLLMFPVVLGEGKRLFRDVPALIRMRLEEVESVGEAALMRYQRLSAPDPPSHANHQHTRSIG